MASLRRSDGPSDAIVGGALDAFAQLGSFATFAWHTLTAVPTTVRLYHREVLQQFKDLVWGTGAIIVGGGTVAVMVLLSVSAGTSLGIQGFTGLEMVGLAPLTGFIAAAANTRELAPLVAALALGAQVGCRFTAQIGSMRVHEEIDALEVMAIRPVRYVVATRVVACMMSILPLYLVGLLGSYLATRMTVVWLFGQSPGQYDHYFSTFLQASDVLLSVVKILVFALTIALIHSWYGFKVGGGGPQAVGVATGEAIRASIVSVVVLDMILTLLFWGTDPGFRLSG